MTIIVGRKGNQRLPIKELTVSQEHCKITSNGDGTYTVENLSLSSFTKVDGKDIIKTTATPDANLELGPKFKCKLKDLLPLQASNNPNQSQKQVFEFSISHLKYLWNEFDRKNQENINKQKKINHIRAGLGIFTMCAMPTIYFLGPFGLAFLGYCLTGVGIIGNIYSFVGMKNIESPQESKKRREEFELEYCCPNPECKKSLPLKPYNYIRHNYKNCPYCKCKYIEK